MNIQCNDEKIEIEEGSSGKDVAQKLGFTSPNQAIALRINGEIRDLSHPLKEGDEISFLNFEEKEGKEVFWHTSAHVLAQAVLRLWPDAIPTIGPPIENGFYYDFANLEISADDFPKIEKEIAKILSENYRPEREDLKGKENAIRTFGENPYKKELIESFEEGSPITAYKQGEFFDLCRGPHLPALSKIKAFKVMKTSGAYWRGDNTREMLTRIYGISFPDRKSLKEYLFMLEEAKKRDHRIVGAKLDLFSFKEEAPGMPFIHPKGITIWNRLLEFMRSLHDEAGYVEIKTPQLVSKGMWETSGHWDHYKENMYICPVDDHEHALKPMNCPGCMLFYKTHIHSYRELPYRVAEFGHVHRHEASGALNGLFRVRSFHQDDAHHFMKPEDIKQEILEVIKLADTLYSTFGLTYFFELSTRPEKSKTIGSDEEWELATSSLKQALDESGRVYNINEGDGAFYGPKIDVHIKDALGRTWQCGTIQLDMSLPEKFDLAYMDATGVEKRPVMIHRALFGSIERFFGIIIEHFAGKFPVWISPLPVRLIPVADRHVEYAKTVRDMVKKAGFICDIDSSGESVSKKVRNAQLQQINYMLTVGDKEMENATINLRTRDNVVHGELKVEKFVENISVERQEKALVSPFAKKE